MLNLFRNAGWAWKLGARPLQNALKLWRLDMHDWQQKNKQPFAKQNVALGKVDEGSI